MARRPKLWIAITLLSMSLSGIARADGATTIFLPLIRRDGPTLGGCGMFPPDNAWNRDISNDPVDPNSDNFIAYISQTRGTLHPDFGEPAEYGIPFVVVPPSQPVPHPAERADRGRVRLNRGPACAGAAPGRVQVVRTFPRLPERVGMGCRLGRGF
jgi:hypothetical protein